MRPTTVYTLFFSPTGTSKKIADAIARGLARDANRHDTPAGEAARSSDPVPVRIIDLTHAPAPAATLEADTAAIFAVPVYGGHVPPVALERMRELRGEGTPTVIVAVYGNRSAERAAAELAAYVSERGFVAVAAAAFVGEHSYSTPSTPIAAGRPDAQDLAEAEAFGAAVGRKLAGAAAETGAAAGPHAAGVTSGDRSGDKAGSGQPAGAAAPLAPIDVRKLRTPRTPLLPLLRFIRFAIAYIHKQRKNPVRYLPETDADRCTGCGRCAAHCPTQAIARGDELHTDPERCIRCCACVKRCPIGARTFVTPFAAALSRNFTERKPPVMRL